MKQITLLALFMGFSVMSAAQTATELRCEYMDSPIGIDESSPRFTWRIDDQRPGEYQTAYRILVGTDSLAVANGEADIWDSGKVESGKVLAVFGGKALESFSDYWWNVTYWDSNDVPHRSRNACFATAFMRQDQWKGYWISDGQDISGNGIEERRAPYFRKEINIAKKVRSAKACISAAGYYELSLNGEKVGDHRLDPMYTRYDRRNLYSTFDVTSRLNDGANAIGVLLGNGWYNHQSTAVWFFDRAPWRNRPTFCMDLHVEYEDGTVETFYSDTTWRTSLGPVVFNSIYTAEHHDARLEQPGWDKPGFDASEWIAPINRAAPSRNIVSQVLHPIRDIETIDAKSARQINDTTWIFDFGRNIAGVTEFTIAGERGTTFRLKHGEVLRNGRLDNYNIEMHYRPTDDSDPFATDIYTLSGNGKEHFRPLFNYKGFQYVEVTCDRPVSLSVDNLKAYFMHTDFPACGSVETSNELINKLWWASNNSYLSNFFGYPTDCPQREKNGWTGDGGIAAELGLYNFDGITLYEKWLADHRDEQQPNGVLPCIIPTSGWGYHWANGLDWTSTIATIPWTVYLFYGDPRLLERCYDNIKAYVDRVTELYPEGLTDWGLGDWIPVKSETPVELTSSIYYFNDARILARAAEMFGKTGDAQKYAELAVKIQNAVNAKYLNRETGIYAEGNQTAQCVPLMWGIVPDDMKAKVAYALAERVKADDNHIDVGLLGTKAILNALSENGYADLAYALATCEDFPSWGNWIKHGATTFYEDWPAEWEGQNPLSLNHIMFGEINAWFYKALGGIKPDPENPGFKNVILAPKFVAGLSHAKVEHESLYGTIVSEWTRGKKSLKYSVTVPANSTASLYLQDDMTVKSVEYSGTSVQLNPDQGCYHLNSGTYIFTLK